MKTKKFMRHYYAYPENFNIVAYRQDGCIIIEAEHPDRGDRPWRSWHLKDTHKSYAYYISKLAGEIGSDDIRLINARLK